MLRVDLMLELSQTPRRPYLLTVEAAVHVAELLAFLQPLVLQLEVDFLESQEEVALTFHHRLQLASTNAGLL